MKTEMKKKQNASKLKMTSDSKLQSNNKFAPHLNVVASGVKKQKNEKALSKKANIRTKWNPQDFAVGSNITSNISMIGYIPIEASSIYKLHLQKGKTYVCKHIDTGKPWCGVKFYDDVRKIDWRFDSFQINPFLHEQNMVLAKISAVGIIKHASMGSHCTHHYASQFYVQEILTMSWQLNRETGHEAFTTYKSPNFEGLDLLLYEKLDKFNQLHKVQIVYDNATGLPTGESHFVPSFSKQPYCHTMYKWEMPKTSNGWPMLVSIKMHDKSYPGGKGSIVEISMTHDGKYRVIEKADNGHAASLHFEYDSDSRLKLISRVADTADASIDISITYTQMLDNEVIVHKVYDNMFRKNLRYNHVENGKLTHQICGQWEIVEMHA